MGRQGDGRGKRGDGNGFKGVLGLDYIDYFDKRRFTQPSCSEILVAAQPVWCRPQSNWVWNCPVPSFANSIFWGHTMIRGIIMIARTNLRQCQYFSRIRIVMNAACLQIPYMCGKR